MPLTSSLLIRVHAVDLLVVDGSPTYLWALPATSVLCALLALAGDRRIEIGGGTALVLGISFVVHATTVACVLAALGLSVSAIVLLATDVVGLAFVVARHHWSWAASIGILGALLSLTGFVHVVHGPRGTELCRRDRWGASNLFADAYVDTDDFQGQHLDYRPEVTAALMACGIASPSEPATVSPPRPVLDFCSPPGHRAGICEALSSCTGHVIRGYCPGDDGVACCVLEP